MAGKRKLIVEIIGDASSLQRSFKASEAAVTGFGRSIAVSTGSFVRGAVVFAAVNKAIEAVTGSVHAGIHEYTENARVAALTHAQIKATGGIAGVTGKQVDDLGLRLSNLSGVNDEVIRSGENVLLSFRNIRNQAGKGNQVFTRATKDVLDFAVATGREMPQAAQLLGRALEDPARKATALSRAGIVLSKGQLELIKKWEQSGNALKAQKFLLTEVERRFKGAAAAAGKTLPAQLEVLRERFRDLAGQGIGLIAPTVIKAVSGLTGFVRAISEASGGGAKLAILGKGVKDLASTFADLGTRILTGARSAFERIDWTKVFDVLKQKIPPALRAAFAVIGRNVGQLAAIARDVGTKVADAFRAVNWDAVAKAIGSGLRRALDSIAKVVDRVDWRAVGLAVIRGFGQAGAFVSRAAVGLIRAATSAIRSANWQQVGKAIIAGFAAAVAAVGNFLLHVNWGALIGATFHLIVAVIKASTGILVGAGKALATALYRAISSGLAAIGRTLELEALKIVLKILKVFDREIPGIHRHLIPGLHSLVNDIKKQIAQMQTAIDSLHGKTVTVKVQTQTVDISAQPAVRHGRTVIPTPAPTTRTTSGKTETGFGLVDQAQKAKAAAAAARKAAAAAAAAVQRLLDGLDLAVQKATLTKTLKDDVAANEALIVALKRQVALHKDDLSLQSRLVSAEQERLNLIQQQREQAAAALAARQFRTLGLGPTGEDLAPRTSKLRAELKKIAAAVPGTFLDTKANKSLFASIRKLLSHALGNLSDDVRRKIAEMLDAIDQQLKDHGNQPLTKTRGLNTDAVVAGLGLSREEIKRLRARLSHFTTAGRALAGQQSTFGSAAVAGAGGIEVVVDNKIYLDGKQLEGVVTRRQQVRRRRNPLPRRGRR